MMTVKSKRGRRRYVAFITSPEMTKQEMVDRIPGGRTFNVIQCSEGMAIVRCGPSDVGRCEEAVRACDPQAHAVRTSGTLRTLRDEYPVLKKNAPPRPPRRGTPPAKHRVPRYTCADSRVIVII